MTLCTHIRYWLQTPEKQHTCTRPSVARQAQILIKQGLQQNQARRNSVLREEMDMSDNPSPKGKHMCNKQEAYIQ